MLKIVGAALAALALGCLGYFAKKSCLETKSADLPLSKRIMVVFAHPDDESMFFAPFILWALKQKKRVYLLCLSKGIEPGLTRTKELTKASGILGVTEVTVNGVTDKSEIIFNDGQTEDWPADLVSEKVEEYRQKWNIDTIVTFDNQGVSGHINHIHTNRGITYHSKSYGDKKTSYFSLFSTPLPFKYFSWASIALYTWKKTSHPVFINPNSSIVWDAMRAHDSQYVWFRKIYLSFSSFNYFNMLIPFNAQATN